MSTVVNTIKNEIKNWWWFLVVGLMSLVAGIAILAKPAEGYVSLSILFSLIMAGTGFSQIIFAISERKSLKGWGWTLASGILDFALGTFLMVYPVITMATLPFIVGFYLVFRAIYLIGASMDLNSLGIKGWGWVLTGGILLLALGFLTLYYPAAGALGIVAYSGYAFLVSGVFNMVLAFLLKSLKTDIEQLKDGIEIKTAPNFRKEFRNA